MLRVAVIYHMWPHYRHAVAVEMDRSKKVSYTFYGSGVDYDGIPHADVSSFRRFVQAPFRFHGKMMWQPAAIRAASKRDFDAIIYLANPNFASTWVSAILARRSGIRVFFWAHGWLKEDRGFRRILRNLFFRRADKILVYAERGKKLGIKAGFPADSISVIYNSLDVIRADEIISRIEDGSLNSHRPETFFRHPNRPVLICTARITKLCRFDLLIEAARLLNEQGRPVNILLVGDGPEKKYLEEMARDSGVSSYFFGACYDEEILAQLIYHADLTVSPGKIGLTAMHSLMYGTPAVTHDNLDEQMPEVEALEEGLTGSLFRQGDAASLASKITDWISVDRSRKAVRTACRTVISNRWNPRVQAHLIETAILETTGNAATYQ